MRGILKYLIFVPIRALFLTFIYLLVYLFFNFSFLFPSFTVFYFLYLFYFVFIFRFIFISFFNLFSMCPKSQVQGPYFFLLSRHFLCNTPRFSSRCFTRWLVLCAFRPRGMLVIARRGYLSVFWTQNLHFQLFFLSLKHKDRICPLFLTPLDSSQLTLLLNQSFQPLCEWSWCMLEALDNLGDCKPTFILPPCSSSL